MAMANMDCPWIRPSALTSFVNLPILGVQMLTLPSLFNLGCAASENGDVVAAMRHFRLAASGGDKGSMDGLIECFERGLIRHADLSKTVQAMYLSRDEMKSEGRDQYIAYLKRTGKYDANLGM